MNSAASPFIVDDAIVGPAQPLTKAMNHLASGPRRACDLIEELGRREDFYLDLAGGSSGRIAGAVFHNAHLPDKLPCANRAEKDGVAIEFPEYVDGTAEEAKNTVRRIPSLKRTCPSAKCARVIAVLSIGNRWRTRRGQTSLPTSAGADASTHTGNIDGIYHLRNPRNTAASIQALPSDAHLGPAVFPRIPNCVQRAAIFRRKGRGELGSKIRSKIRRT